MTTIQQARDAANKRPAMRTADEQRIVDSNMGDLSVRNANHEAERQQKIHGAK